MVPLGYHSTIALRCIPSHLSRSSLQSELDALETGRQKRVEVHACGGVVEICIVASLLKHPAVMRKGILRALGDAQPTMCGIFITRT